MNPYDDVPYPSHAFAATAPDRLATVGAIFGLQTVDPRRARVLELGSSSGGNVLGHAIANPDSAVLGLDLSERQIRLGQQTITDLGVTNARLEVADLMTWQPEEGAWDYVICHGVYSWVPEPVQRAILAICRRALSPHGVAVVSWNANPGWHVQGMVRDAMRYLVDPRTPLAHRAARGQDVVRVLASAATVDTPNARMLSTIASQFEILPDSYIAHEYLEAHNQPLYLAEFTRHVAVAGLRYLADSNVADGLPHLQSPELQARLGALAKSQVEWEQYLDFLHCRPFRTSLLVRPDAPVQLNLNQLDGAGFWMARAQPAPAPAPDPWPLSTALVQAVADAAPGALSFDDAVATLHAADQRAELTHAMLAAAFTGRLQLHREPHAAIRRAGPLPAAWSYARHQAGRQHLVSNLWHDTAALDPLDLLLLRKCDGAHTVDEIATSLTASMRMDEPDAVPLLRERIDALAMQGFFVA